MKTILVFSFILLAGLCLADNEELDLGTPASIEEFPAIVQVEVGYEFLWLQGCAGSVITSLHILSAARCFSGRLYSTKLRRIRAGSAVRDDGGEIVPILQANNHPSFGANAFDGDITVVRLEIALTLGATIQQTPIINQGNLLPDGSSVVAAGWGSIAQGTLLANRDLHSVDLITVNNAACADFYGSLFIPITVTNNMVCSGRPATGGRRGDLRDAGGPLYFSNVLVGVHTFGNYLGFNASFPLVSTSVSSYTQWIVESASA